MGIRKTTEQFIEDALCKHLDEYNYKNVKYINNKIKVEILCLKCNNYFLQRPDRHLKGSGCPFCKGTSKRTKEKFIMLAKNIHNNLYDYDKVFYINNHTKVKILCKKCNEYFWQTPKCHINRKQGCLKCAILNNSKENSNLWKGGVKQLDYPLYETFNKQLSPYIKTKKVIIDGFSLVYVECKLCKHFFLPTVQSIQHKIEAINGKVTSTNDLYCSEECKSNCSTFNRKKFPKNYKIYVKSRFGQTLWAENIKKNADYTCQICGSTKVTLYAHHIIPYVTCNLLSLDPDNGICLCKNCHKKVHNIPGCTIKELKNGEIDVNKKSY